MKNGKEVIKFERKFRSLKLVIFKVKYFTLYWLSESFSSAKAKALARFMRSVPRVEMSKTGQSKLRQICLEVVYKIISQFLPLPLPLHPVSKYVQKIYNFNMKRNKTKIRPNPHSLL